MEIWNKIRIYSFMEYYVEENWTIGSQSPSAAVA